jgi:hypothetical protein
MVQEILEFPASFGMSEAAQGLCLYLPDPFTGYVEIEAHLFQGKGIAVVQAEAHFKHLLLT